ncbi:hypothetical protein PGT21_012133 [Puccinia graminis f. sp. tritici]|uniref:Uncharacterized protein n=1 Tax=Puccinia graminis f. sp. tritici TaxID=56615 RepID=A0A5B0R237_PUCGR|nr:hypothetical protein PGT21_012133 [Puccinia graminis f. sp. tritici]
MAVHRSKGFVLDFKQSGSADVIARSQVTNCLQWLTRLTSSCLDWISTLQQEAEDLLDIHSQLGKHSTLLPAPFSCKRLRYDTPHPCLWGLERAKHILATSTEASFEDLIWLFH